MRKVINGKTYNTETATLLREQATGVFGDPRGYEEHLYMTKKGNYFLYSQGGPDSPYPKPSIISLTSEMAERWKRNELFYIEEVE